MHDTAMETGRLFFRTYAGERAGLTILDVGAQAVNGSLRSVAPDVCRYVGIDFVAGKGVDVVITDAYALPFDDESADIVVCSSVFEHAEFFWLLFEDIQRVLKPDGLFYLSVPSNGEFHRYPVDCWRFYPDSGIALQNWGRRNGRRTLLLESFTTRQRGHVWNDFVAVFLKDEAHAARFPRRMQSDYRHYRNGWIAGAATFSRPSRVPEDQELHLLRRLRRSLINQAYEWYLRLPPAWQKPLFALYHRGDKND